MTSSHIFRIILGIKASGLSYRIEIIAERLEREEVLSCCNSSPYPQGTDALIPNSERQPATAIEAGVKIGEGSIQPSIPFFFGGGNTMTLDDLYDPFRVALVEERNRRVMANDRDHAAVSIAIDQTVLGLDQLLKVLYKNPIESKDKA